MQIEFRVDKPFEMWKDQSPLYQAYDAWHKPQ